MNGFQWFSMFFIVHCVILRCFLAFCVGLFSGATAKIEVGTVGGCLCCFIYTVCIGCLLIHLGLFEIE